MKECLVGNPEFKELWEKKRLEMDKPGNYHISRQEDDEPEEYPDPDEFIDTEGR